MSGNVNVAGRNFLGLHDIHVFKLLNELVKFLNSLLVLIIHHSLNVGDGFAQMWSSNVEMLIPDFIEHRDLACEKQIRSFLVFGQLLSHFFIWVDNHVIYGNCAGVDSIELIQQSFVRLVNAERRHHIDVSIEHDDSVNLTFCLTLILVLVDV